MMSILDYFLSRDLKKPVAAQIRALETLLEECGRNPTYPDCQDVCDKTRNIFQLLHSRFIDKREVADIPLFMGHAAEEGAAPSYRPETRSIYGDALQAFGRSVGLLQHAVKARHFSAEQTQLVEVMIDNLQDRITDLEVLVDPSRGYAEKWTALVSSPIGGYAAQMKEQQQQATDTVAKR